MEPDKSATEPELSQVISTEYSVKHLVEALETLLHSNTGVDEHKAKQLRKDWEVIQNNPNHDSVDLSVLEKGFEQLRQRVHKQVEQRNKRYAAIEHDLVNLSQALKADDLQTSQQFEKKIINGLNSITGLSSQRRQKVIGELESLQPKIKKLSSWRHWGTEKAREKIIDEISNLHSTEKDLEKIAKRIQQAREEWKQWDQSGEGGDKKLYKKFDAACTKSYEPCKALFEAKRKQRQSASRLRTEVCENLEREYEKTDWRSPDWKLLQQLIREQTNRWRKLGAAEYRDRKPLQKRYDEIIKKFDGPLDRERKQNFRQRQELVAEIQKLVEITDNRKAMGELQALKKNWLVSVSGGRKQEQSIWKQFTSACDAVYEKSRSARKAFDQELKEHLKSKRDLCDEIKTTLSESPSLDGEQLARQIKVWKMRWSETGRTPKSDARRIDKEFNDVLTEAKNILKSLNSRRQSERDQILFDNAEKCTKLEKLIFESGSEESMSDQIEQHFSPGLTTELEQALQSRLNAVSSAAKDKKQYENWTTTFNSNFQKINDFLLQLEINAGVDSPGLYAKKRMALQIGRLSAALGKAAEHEILDTQELINRIHTTGAVTPDQQTEINKRFKHCHQAIYHE